MNTTYVTAPMPPELARQARLTAARLEISRAELVRRAVTEFLRRAEAAEEKKGEGKNGK
jgi:metal-responsive CopG/Arc/MetJ family transcriptional regulator